MTNISKTLEDDLKRLVIKVPRGTSEEEGVGLEAGSFGYVYQITIGGVPRMVKKLHKTLIVGVSKKERDCIVERFKKECLILSKLRHPNIVQFIGVFYGTQGKNDIGLVMEKLDQNLFKFLDINDDVKLATKVSILYDVSYGLLYLHECNPPVIHRDLTAHNILLNGNLQAKIADLGVAKLIDQASAKAAISTVAPGQVFYMPPEAKLSQPTYTHKLDIFSFGHLCLHTLLQKYPNVFEIKFAEAKKHEGFIEKLKRQAAFDQIGSDHVLHSIIVQCLSDDPEQRPDARKVNTEFIHIKGLQSPAKCLQVERQGERQPNEYAETQYEKGRDTWTSQVKKHTKEVRALTGQVETIKSPYNERKMGSPQSKQPSEELNLKLKRENEQLLSENDRLYDAYQTARRELTQMEQQLTEYEKEYHALLNDYVKLQQLAQQNGLQVPKKGLTRQASHLPGQSNPYEDQYTHRPYTWFGSSHVPANRAYYLERPVKHFQGLTAEPGVYSSPSFAQVGHGSRDPSFVNRITSFIPQNELMQNVDNEGAESARSLNTRKVKTSLITEGNTKSPDSDYFCRRCNKAV